jgi:hypothetical protein
MTIGRRTSSSVQQDRAADAAERARTVATRPIASVQALGLGTSRLLAAATLDDGRVLVVVPGAAGWRRRSTRHRTATSRRRSR